MNSRIDTSHFLTPIPRRGFGVFFIILLVFGGLRNPNAEELPSPPEASGNWLPAEQVSKICAELKETLGGAESFSGSFTEYKYLSIFTEPVVSEGRIYLTFPSRVRMETTAPFETVFVARNKALTRWEKEGEEWNKVRMGSPEPILRVLEQMTFWMRGDLCRNPDAFGVTAWQADSVTMRLTPKLEDIRQFIEAIDITLSEARDQIKTLTIREANGDYTFIVYDEIIKNPDLAPQLFEAGPAPWFPPIDASPQPNQPQASTQSTQPSPPDAE